MNCYECDGTYQEKSDLLEINDPYVGTIAVQGILYYQCDNCDDFLYTEAMSRAIEVARNNRMRELLYQFPIGDFLSATETSSVLGISRQALHKNRRINHGFVHQTTFGGVTVYLNQSVLQFKKTGDGRFPLHLYISDPRVQYVTNIVPLTTVPVHYNRPRITESRWFHFRKSYLSLEENSYAK